jgi:hypothetical protein
MKKQKPKKSRPAPKPKAGLDVPIHIASEGMDLSADLKRGLSYARTGAKKKKQPSK